MKTVIRSLSFLLLLLALFGCSQTGVSSSNDTGNPPEVTDNGDDNGGDDNGGNAGNPGNGGTPGDSDTPVGETITLVSIPDQATGSLDALRVAVSPSYGLFKTSYAPYDYIFSRDNINGVCWDLYNQEFCINYLYPSLDRCGAFVIPVRDREYGKIGVSGQETWKENALLYLQSIGAAAASVPSIADTTVRSWHAINMDADCFLAVSISTTGTPTGTTARGTLVYVWNSTDGITNPPTDTLPAGTGPLMQSASSNIFKAASAIDSTWKNRGVAGMDFGTLRVLKDDHLAGNSHVPGVHVALGFADNALDVEQLKTPAMKVAMARALTVSLIDSMTAKTGLYPPARPGIVSATKHDGLIELTWLAGTDPFTSASTAPKAYVIKVFSNTGAYLGSLQVSADTLTAKVPAASGSTVTIKVSARNEYGESADSDAVSVTM